MTIVHTEHLADAYELVAKANHYMVGIMVRDHIEPDVFDAVEQILITRQNNEN